MAFKVTLKWHAVAAEIERQYGLDFVVAISERNLLPAAEIRSRFNLYGKKPEEVILFRNKLKMKERLLQHGFRVPQFRSITSPIEARGLLDMYKKIVLKPIDGMGSKNTFIVNEPSDLLYLEQCNLDFSNYEAEEFIDGEMYHIDSIIENGQICIASVFRYMNPTLDYNLSKPIGAVMEGNLQRVKVIKQFNEKILSCLGITNGVTHLEIFYTPDNEIVFCEVAARPGGCAVAPAMMAAWDTNIIEEMIKTEVSIPLNQAHLPMKQYSGWVTFPPLPGVVEDISTEAEFNEDWIYECKIKPVIGDKLSSPYMSGDYVAKVTVTGSSEKEVFDRLSQIKKRFVLRVNKAPKQGESYAG